MLLALAAGWPVNAREAARGEGGEKAVTSPGPGSVELTVYRAPYGNGALDLRSLGGFAMVTETRKIRLPRGRAVLRFEGVAEGIIPVSAVIEGLPGGTVEKNRDARLLSPSSLVDGTLGRQVTVTRTDKVTGNKVSEEATIVAGPRPGVVLRTATGVETLRCSGLPERLEFAGVPAGLSSKPVLSVVTDSPSARTVSVRLSYIASGFDWRASYVATQASDGRSLDLFAWLSLGNGNPQGFADAQVRAVAGKVNRVATPMLRAAVGALRLQCFPLGTTTSNLREHDDIIVTASRGFESAPAMAMTAMSAPPPPAPPPPPPEDLGDLKLYRVPERVTVSPRSQKQVALLARGQVPFERRYRRPVYPGQRIEAVATTVVLVLRNKSEAGLGLALPAGSTALYANGQSGERLLLGLGSLTDRAEGETFRLAAGSSTQVVVTQQGGPARESVITASNANPFPVVLEVPIGSAGQKIKVDGAALDAVDGIATWSVTLAPRESAQLYYRF
ncbi:MULTISPECIES: DUF4139 domain-containing protein [unclassified Novosphingobium]|uniref:DUF4139 domain-containing protein n=1 Tax=unclassified Novosphingobium TaxID=2644732 RepID=UPI00135C1A66|nr:MULTISPECIES: hypothetical protein [unclassified Novosphingobium]